MKQANTLQVRAIINAAFKQLKHQTRGSWTDTLRKNEFSNPMRTVTYGSAYASEIAKLAQKKLRVAGYSNQIRVTDNGTGWRGGKGPYLKVEAELG